MLREPTMSRASDQRTFERVPFGQKVKVVSKGKMVAYAMAINIGMGGVLLNASPILPVGSQCRLAIPVPGEEGLQRLNAEGTVVWSTAEGTAVKFVRTLEPSRFEALVQMTRVSSHRSPLDSYLDYFRVSMSKDLADCERLLGVSKQTFRTSFYLSFASCISLAILPVWVLRSSIPAIPDWTKVLLSFGYAAVWIAVIQPAVDLTVFHFVRHNRSSSSSV